MVDRMVATFLALAPPCQHIRCKNWFGNFFFSILLRFSWFLLVLARFFSRERLRRVFRKKAAVVSHLQIYIFTPSHLHLHICTSTSSHDLHICTSTSSHLHIYLFSPFTSAHLPFHTIFISAISSQLHIRRSRILSFFFSFGAPRNATLCAEIARVESAKCRWDCVYEVSDASLCGDRACGEIAFFEVSRAILCADRARREREMQVRLCFWRSRAQPSAEIVRAESAKCRWDCFWGVAGNPSCVSRALNVGKVAFLWGVVGKSLRRSCVSRARNAGEIAFLRCRAQPDRRVSRQPSVKIVCVKGAKCRWDWVGSAQFRSLAVPLWAVARMLAWVFSCLAVLWAVRNWDCASLRSLAVPLGSCANFNACVSCFLALL